VHFSYFACRFQSAGLSAFSTEASAIHGGARQPEVDARIFNNVRKADLANMKIPRWWRIPPIAG